jgi:hypothetical protein
VDTLNWSWIAFEVVAPTIVGFLVAYPFWRYEQPILGNLAGSIVMFGTAFALIMREHVEIDTAVRACLDQGFTCFPSPTAFTRYAVYASIALAEVIGLFSLSLRVEEKVRRRGYSPEWR